MVEVSHQFTTSNTDNPRTDFVQTYYSAKHTVSNLFEAYFSAHNSNPFPFCLRFQSSFKVCFVGIWKHTTCGTYNFGHGLWTTPIHTLDPFLPTVTSSQMNIILWELGYLLEIYQRFRKNLLPTYSGQYLAYSYGTKKLCYKMY